MKQSVLFVIMNIILLRQYARHTDRRKRTAFVSLGFIIFHLIHSLFSSAPLLIASELLASAGKGNPKYAAAEGAALIIFYNLFIPHENQENSDIANAINVTRDQMGQVSAALHRLEDPAGHRKSERKGVVFYNLIGNEAALPPDKMSDLCHQLHPRLDCQRIEHYRNATESVTLTSLHDFCHSDLATGMNRTRVSYLHSKGSFHDHEKQAPWRRQLTNASLHPGCLYPPDDTCDVCGAQYYLLFASVFPGNMWTAKCSYIRKLLKPEEGGEYIRRREAAVKQDLILQSEGIIENNLGHHQDVFYGLDRYQWEHWVGGHPSLIPCEMHSPNIGFWDMVSGKVAGRHYDWGMGPRRMFIFDTPGESKRYSIKNDESNFRQHYFLAGNIIKWLNLYDAIPTQDSWVWKHFPAGNMWKEVVMKHGKKALHELIQRSKPKFQPPFASNHSATVGSPTKIFDEESLSQAKPPIVVFYHISFPPGGDNKKAEAVLRDQFDVLSMGQYDNVPNSRSKSITILLDRKVLLYYSIAGGSAQEKELVSQLCKDRSSNIICRQLGIYDSDFVSGETLSQLHSFCNVKPSSHVVYIANQFAGPDDKSKYDVTKIKAATSAVMSKMCQPSEETCNVCGTEFYPLPFLQFTGNMFSASCGYVKNLLPPKKFEKEMYDVAGDAFIGRLRKQFTSQLFELTPRILGVKQYSVEHWIGAHPDLKPCDVAPMSTEKIDGTIKDQMKHYSWSLAPRRGSSREPAKLAGEKESDFRLKREAAFREYFYLAGNVFRWHRFYDKVPDADSWVWKWFPDAKSWETAASSGAEAVNAIATELSSESGMDTFWVK
ncbi:hypothetical protein ACHAXR_007985 [Thalassiosira sp. AJA248-18]